MSSQNQVSDRGCPVHFSVVVLFQPPSIIPESRQLGSRFLTSHRLEENNAFVFCLLVLALFISISICGGQLDLAEVLLRTRERENHQSNCRAVSAPWDGQHPLSPPNSSLPGSVVFRKGEGCHSCSYSFNASIDFLISPAIRELLDFRRLPPLSVVGIATHGLALIGSLTTGDLLMTERHSTAV